MPAKVFPALLKLRNPETEESSQSVVTRQVRRLFQHILARLDGYLDSPVYALNWSAGEVTILHHFSARGPVTEHEVDAAVDTFRAQCRNGSLLGAATFCDHVGAYQAFDLCRLDICEPFSTSCSSQDGLVSCSCHSGFFRAHALDRTCTACESGFWLENGVCTRIIE
ncbi:protein HEG homolog 1-like [Vipera latastei]